MALCLLVLEWWTVSQGMRASLEASETTAPDPSGELKCELVGIEFTPQMLIGTGRVARITCHRSKRRCKGSFSRREMQETYRAEDGQGSTKGRCIRASTWPLAGQATICRLNSSRDVVSAHVPHLILSQPSWLECCCCIKAKKPRLTYLTESRQLIMTALFAFLT